MKKEVEKILPSPLSIAGSKYSMLKHQGLKYYIPRMTDNHYVFFDLFMGTGIMFFNVQCVSAILNDIDDEIFNFWNVVLDDTTYPIFMKELDKVWVGKAWYEKYIQQPDSISQAIAFYIRNRNNYSGVESKEITFDRAKPKPFPKDLTRWKQKMDHTYLQIWNKDFREALTIINRQKTHDREKYFIFEDPPYVSDKLQFYKHKFVEQDHRDLSELNHQSPHQILMTNEDHPLNWELYADWYIEKIDCQYFMNKNKTNGTELLISNQPIQKYSYDDKEIKFKQQKSLSGMIKHEKNEK